MLYEYLNTDWLDRYRSNLSLFNEDLELLIEDDFKIYVAVDFYDIFRYCFPYERSSNSDKLWKNPKFINKYYRDQISRSTMLLMQGNIYQKPNALLAPYVIECDDFIEFSSKRIDRCVYWEKRMGLDKLEQGFLDLIRKSKENEEYDELIDYLNKNNSKLIYYYSRGFLNSVKVFFNVMKNYFTSNAKDFFNDWDVVEKDFFSILQNFNQQELEDYNKIKKMVYDVRRKFEKEDQNIRDAEAIYTTIYLNKIYNKDKKAFILISSAAHLKKLMKKNDAELTLDINGKKIKILRDPEYFLTTMIGISNHLNYTMNKINSKDIAPKDLYISINRELSKLNNYFGYLAGAGGRIKQVIEFDLKKELEIQYKVINEFDLSVLTDEYLAIEPNTKYYNDLQRETAKGIQEAFLDGTFTNRFFRKKIEFEIMRLQYLISTMKSHKELLHLHIALFNLPFRVKVRDHDAKKIIDEIINENINAKLEFKKDSEISEKRSETIRKLLDKLLIVANDMGNDEKLIVWQLAFLYLGRFDIVDNLYDMFGNSVPDELKRELSYLYTVNFVKKVRTTGEKNSKIFENMVKLCDQYGCVKIEQIDTDLDLDSIYENNYELKFCCGSEYIKSSLSMEKIKLGNDILAFIEKDDGIQNAYILYENNNGFEIDMLDIRFIHLKATILNRYVLDYSKADRGGIALFINEFKEIYNPFVRLVDPDYKIAVLSDFAYLLSLNDRVGGYEKELIEALKIMEDLEKSIDMCRDQDPAIEAYWGYVRDYIIGYIYMRIFVFSDKNAQKIRLENAITHFNKSIYQLPPTANSLRAMVWDKIRFCQQIMDLFGKSCS